MARILEGIPESLYDKFTRLRDAKGSSIIQGLDPSSYEQGKRAVDLAGNNEGLIGFKPNLKFFMGEPGMGEDPDMIQLYKIARAMDPETVRILDFKTSDGVGTNEAEIRIFGKTKCFDYVTIAPASGDIEDTIKFAAQNGMGTISMGVMSFNGVLRKIERSYDGMLQDVERAIDAGTQGIVMGATAYIPEGSFIDEIAKLRSQNKYPITELEMSDDQLVNALGLRNKLFEKVIEMTSGMEIPYLVPGLKGNQGGKLEFFIQSGIDLDLCMVNAGSAGLKAEDPIAYRAELNADFNAARESYRRV